VNLQRTTERAHQDVVRIGAIVQHTNGSPPLDAQSGGIGHRRECGGEMARESEPETIETGPQIRRAAGDTNTRRAEHQRWRIRS
jgi:hypothetical protein